MLAVALTAVLAVPTKVQARVWTSASDSGRTFEADYVKCEEDVVTVRMKSGRTFSFPLSTVSEKDKEFVRKQLGVPAKKDEPKPKKAAREVFNLNWMFNNKLVKVDADGKTTPFHYEEGKFPQYYLLYVSAYW